MAMSTALVAAWVVTAAWAAVAAPVLRSADVRITITSPTSCDVTMSLTIDGATEIDHRVDAPTPSPQGGFPPSPQGGFGGQAGEQAGGQAGGQAAGIELVGVRGALRVGDIRAIGRTLSLVLRPDHAAYEFVYRARQSNDRAYRCPIWLPAVPADGQSRAVRLHLDLPPGTAHGASMPALTWIGAHGSTTLGHLPAFVRVSYGSEHESRWWSIGQVMDALAVAVFAGATVIWVWRRRR